MISSILMLFSQYNKNSMLMNTCAIAWVFYALSCSNFQFTPFAIINLATFSITTFFVRKIKNVYLNLCGAILSILLYSICIDVVCYYVYPQFVIGQNLFLYIWNGILFNSKYVFSNILIVFFFMILEKLMRIQKDFHYFLQLPKTEP
jgi:hypothetical protein